MAEKTNSGLVAYAKAQVGKPYWYGTFGQTATASLLTSKKAQYPDYYTASDFTEQIGKRVHDCVGLIKGYLWSTSATATPTYNSSQDKSAAGMYSGASKKGKISTFPETAGLLVFKGTSVAKIHHVGIYGGDGYVYEAKGHEYGVVKTKYQKSDWNYWAQCAYITDDTTETVDTSKLAAADSKADPKELWDYFMGKINNAFGVSGLLANLYSESGLVPINLQNTYNTKLGMTDAEYTAAVDDGSYTAFSSDSAGYGLAQWTYSTRKKALKEYADGQKASIGNAAMQAAYVYKELSESYASVLKALKNATSCLEASNAVLTGYEKPANQGSSVQAARAKYAQEYYDKYAGTSTTASTATSTSTSTSGSTATKTQKATAAAKKYLKSLAGTYTATVNLNVRNDAGKEKTYMVTIPKGTTLKNYGYYSLASDGTKWLYIQFTYKNVEYIGFASSTYLTK